MSRDNKSIGKRAFEAILIVLLLPLIILGLVLHTANKIVVYLIVWLWWIPRGKDVLFVSSNSPIWKEYMETQILPFVAERATVIDWSARQNWPKWSFTVRVFRTFGRGRDFNPMVVLFRPLRRAKIFRFLPAFRDWKQGNTQDLDRLRNDLMRAL